MDEKLNVPDIGDSDSIELVTWKVKAGDTVRKDQELCELVTDKAAFPLEAPFDGKVISLLRKQGDMVKVGETLLTMRRL